MAQESKGLKYLNVLNTSIQSKTYTFAAFTIIVVIVLIMGAIRPTVLKITQINKEIKSKRIVNQQLDSKLNALTSLTNQYGTSIESFRTLPLLFPAQGNYSYIMSNIEEIAKRNGFALSSISFAALERTTVGTKALKPWGVRISVKGSRANFIKFLSDLEKMPIYPRLNRVSFSNNTDDNGQTSYSIELMIFRIEEPNFYK